MARAFNFPQPGNILVAAVADFDLLVGIPRHVVKIGCAIGTKYVATLPAVVLPRHNAECSAALHALGNAVVRYPFRGHFHADFVLGYFYQIRLGPIPERRDGSLALPWIC